MNANYIDRVSEIKAYTAYTLSDMAACASPDNQTSAGAAWLVGVRDDVLERITPLDTDDFERETEDFAHEIADAAVPVYTGEKWATFTDLGAYAEDMSDLACDSTDMDQLSNIALYVIAERLVSALLAELAEAIAGG